MKLFRRRYMGKNWIRRNAHFAECEMRCLGRLPDATRPARVAECERLGCDGQCHGCAHQWVRLGYYGGRTEMFQEWAPKGCVYHDINSSYPASMLDDMPVGRMTVPNLSNMSVRKALLYFKKMRKTHIGFVECTVEIPVDCKAPPLPFRKDGKLIFPTGELSGVWDYDELMLLEHPLVKGRILSIEKSVWYGKKPAFKAMVERVYSYRDKKRPGYSEGLSFCAKLMLNSLYGKFGMREERSGLVCILPGFDPKPEHGFPINGDHEKDDIWEVERIVHATYIIPQISAHITALSRIRFFNGMVLVLNQGGTLVYGDTDSLTFYGASMVDGSKLGEWKREEPGILLEGSFILPKLYQLRAHNDDCLDPGCPGCRLAWHVPGCKGEEDKSCPGCTAQKNKMKGVMYRAQTTENWNKILPKSKGGEGQKVYFTRVSQHKGMLNQGHATPSVVSANKSVRTTYDKRILLTDGTTRPIHIAPQLTEGSRNDKKRLRA